MSIGEQKIVRNCKRENCQDKFGNCPKVGSDGFPVQCVGPWVEDKYYYLERYLNFSCEARRRFSDKGNAVYIDLFSGPGKCIIRHENQEIDNGGIRALHRDEAPFNEYYYFDISRVNADALANRLQGVKNCHIEHGDSNVLIEKLVSYLLKKKYRYHFAFIDPYGPDGLKFDTLRELAKLDRMDMLIHFPIGAIRRNYDRWIEGEDTVLDEFLGTDIWRKRIKGLPRDKIYRVLIDVYKDQLKLIGYPDEGLKISQSDKDIYAGLPTVPVKNTKNVELYALLLISKHLLGQELWLKVLKIESDGQKLLF